VSRIRGGKAITVTTDVTKRDQVKKLVDATVQTYGRIDVIINNAGLMPQAPLERLKIDEWDRMIDVNIKGVLYGIAAALPHIASRRLGYRKVGSRLTIQALAACLRSKVSASRWRMTPPFLMTIWAVKALEPSLRDRPIIVPIGVPASS
jgi:NADP-dependent 3-hydroxy acid dehydrogenase YdfG